MKTFKRKPTRRIGMKQDLVEIRFKNDRPEPIVVDLNDWAFYCPGLYGKHALVMNNLRGDSIGAGKGRRLVRRSDIASMRRVSSVA